MPGKVTRHSGVDRLNHWVIAACVLVLLATAFLPILGVDFAWVAIHWWTGLVLILAVLAHILRSLFTKPLAAVWIGPRDVRDALAVLAKALRRSGSKVLKPGKYSFAQKLIHLAFSLVVLTAIATGALMLAKVDTPWWERNPYWLADKTWGVIYLLHGLAGMLLITMVMTHVYFALRPEKLMYLRSMVLGWITRDEYERRHDPSRWQVEK